MAKQQPASKNPEPQTLLFQGGYKGDYDITLRRAQTGGSEEWTVLRGTRKGDRVLIYFKQPHSAVIAMAEALEEGWTAADGRIRGRIGKIRILKDPIRFDELRTFFPDWGWLRYPRSKVYLDPTKARVLWKRAHGESSRSYRRWRNVGAGFGDPETNREVERQAIDLVTRRLKQNGYSVLSHESEGVGYDLEATRGSSVLHVEVKGISGAELKFPITAGELNRAKEDPQFRLYAVTSARERSAVIHRFTGVQLVRRFRFKALSYLASER